MTRHHARAASAFLFVLVLVASVFSPRAEATTDRRIRLGVSSPYLNGTTVQSRVTGLEADLASGHFGAVRLYHAWDEWFPQPGEVFLKDAGRDTLPVLSVNSKRRDGTRVYWRWIAEAAPGSVLHNDMVRWARDLKAYGKPIIVTLDHEPDFYRNGGDGHPWYYKKAVEKFVTILRGQGATNVRFGFVGVAWNFDPRSTTKANDYYAGDAWIDVLGVDGYSWGTCRDPKGTWRSVDEIFGAFLTWAADHPGKPLMVAEFGSSEDPYAFGTRKAAWIRDMTARFADAKWNRLEVVTWWDQVHETDRNCDFRIRSSAAARQAFVEAMRAAIFT